MRRGHFLFLGFLTLTAGTAAGQQRLGPVTRQQAIEVALTRGPRLGLALADTFSAYAQTLSARALLNPALAASYSKSAPQYHVSLDLPFDYPWLRQSRIQSAGAARVAAQYRYQFERAAIQLDADTAYTSALASRAHARLSHRTAEDADSLRRMALARRDAGDASDLEVEFATVYAGRLVNVAANDSLAFIASLLDLQAAMGLTPDQVAIDLGDSLTPPPLVPADTVSRPPLLIAAAEAMVTAADLAVQVQRRSVWGSPTLTAGFDTRDPSGAEPGLLPTVGLSLPLPLLNRNQGLIAQAEAESARARAELVLTRRETQARIARAIRERDFAFARIARDRALVESARRVEAMSLTAYREGASSLASVLEAQRNAREVVGQYIDDLASGWNASAMLRALITPSASPSP